MTLKKSISEAQEKYFFERYINGINLDFTYNFIETRYLNSELNYFLLNWLSDKMEKLNIEVLKVD